MTATTDKILSDKADGIGWLTFNNPARRNALSLEMWQAIAEVLTDFENDPEIRVIVLRGAGDKAFVSGADISQFEDQRKNAEQAEAYAKISDSAKKVIDAVRKPMLAMIRGYCVGGGVMMALSADIRIASEDSIYAIPAAKLGLGYSYDSARKLVHVVGPAAAKEILFAGRRMNAQEAHRIGLINQVVPTDRLEEYVREYALEIAGNAPLTLRALKIAVDQALADPAARDMELVEGSIRACFASEDYANGRRAFMEKRKPVFTGR